MSWYSEKPHECHRLEMNLFEVGKGILDIPHLQLRWEKSEPILGSSTETHCMSGEGSGLTFLLFSDANSKVAWGGKHLAWVRRSTHQTYCQGRGLEYPAVPCSIKTAMNNSISELFILDLCAKRMKHFISLAGSGRTRRFTAATPWQSAGWVAGLRYFGPQCCSLLKSVGGLFAGASKLQHVLLSVIQGISGSYEKEFQVSAIIIQFTRRYRPGKYGMKLIQSCSF